MEIYEHRGFWVLRFKNVGTLKVSLASNAENRIYTYAFLHLSMCTCGGGAEELILLHNNYKIKLVWLVGRVLQHIKHCRLLNAKSSLYIYIEYISFGLVRFYGTTTIVGYLMPYPLHTYILDI